jgi:hypothetical protein
MRSPSILVMPFVFARGQSGKIEASISFLTAQHWHALLEMGNGLAALEQR